MRKVSRWLPGLLAGLSLVLAVTAATEHRPLAAFLWAAGAAYWAWQARRGLIPPAHVDEDWARGVLAAAGSPSGVRAVKALRDAEPALSLLAAKQLADRLGS